MFPLACVEWTNWSDLSLVSIPTQPGAPKRPISMVCTSFSCQLPAAASTPFLFQHLLLLANLVTHHNTASHAGFLLLLLLALSCSSEPAPLFQSAEETHWVLGREQQVEQHTVSGVTGNNCANADLLFPPSLISILQLSLLTQRCSCPQHRDAPVHAPSAASLR